MSSLGQWLQSQGLGKYLEVLTANDVDFDVFPQLTEEHLKELGLSLGDRLRFLKAVNGSDPAAHEIRELPQPSVQTTEIPAAAGEAERRQLTVMFCDLVGSTELSVKLDPEDMREVISSFQNVCRDAIQPYGGFIARYMGDGMLIYFGYPQAHEDDAERAVRAGLAVVDAVTALNEKVDAGNEATLAVRVGVATGPVVVGDIVGEGAAEEAAVIGETPNLAARLQGLAKPNQVVVAPTTHRLLESLFEFEDLGAQSLKGMQGEVRAWRALHERNIDGRQEAAGAGAASPLVGRQEELGLLMRSWETTKQGHGQAILLQGEAGIGKSRLIEALRGQIAGDKHLRVTFRCSAYHSNSALYPIIEHLKRAIGWDPEMSEEEKLQKLETALSGQSVPLPESVPLFADLLSLPLPDGRYPPVASDARKRREATLDAIAAWSLEMAESVPVLNVWEDLHWADPSTLELLALYLEQSPTVSMMNVLTYRAEFAPTWPMRSHMVPVTLNRLERPEVEALVTHQASGKNIPLEVVDHIVAKADGVPLYVEELTKAILESGFLQESTDRFELSGALSDISIPATLQDSLMARLDRLPTLREVAQMGAVLGREFAYEMLRAVVGLDEPKLQQGLEQLVADELLYQRGRVPRSKYIFKHALIQDAAYQSLLRRTRQQCHRRVARLIEEQFREIVDSHPELVAHHYQEGAEPRKAIGYWQKAGERARLQSANLEAIAYFSRGLEALEELPDDEERARQELSLQLSLGHATIVAKGHGSVGAEQAYTRALVLSEQLGDTSELIPALFGLWRSFVVGRSLDEASAVALKLHGIAKRQGDIGIEVVANYTSGFTALCMGQPAAARKQLQHSIELYKPNQDSLSIYRAAQDPGVACRGYSAIAEWLLGYPDRARSLAREAVALAEEAQDRFSLAYALCYVASIVYEACDDDAESLINRGLEIAAADGYDLWVAYGGAQKAHLDLVKDTSASALEALRDAIDTVLDLGVYLNTPYLMTLLAEEYLRMGRFAEGLSILDQAQQSLDTRGERWWEAETHRMRGEILLARSRTVTEDAEACFLEALDVCRSQEARGLELRASLSLARLRSTQARNDEARRLVQDCYDQFNEGFDTGDLKEARKFVAETCAP